MSETLNAEDLAWAAGYFDGDGTFSKAAGYAMLAIASTEISLLERFQAAVSAGAISGPFLRKGRNRWSKQPQHALQAYRDARAIAEALWPFLSPAKRAQAEKLATSHTWRLLPCLESSARAPLQYLPRSRVGLAWAAGFFDAEGCFSYSTRTGLSASITQADDRVLRRFRDVTELGAIYGPYRPSANDGFVRKPQYQLRLSGHERVQALYALLWHWLSAPKRNQGSKALSRILVCNKGHRKRAGHGGCGECTKDYWRSYREGKRREDVREAPALYLAS